MIIDADKVFVGSANLDPRSLRINTEMGLLVTSTALNGTKACRVLRSMIRASVVLPVPGGPQKMHEL